MERTFLGSINRAANIQPEVEIQLEIHDTYEERGDEWINIEEPTKAEIRLALKEQKNRKEPRCDNRTIASTACKDMENQSGAE
jgi:hypothetical protein